MRLNKYKSRKIKTAINNGIIVVVVTLVTIELIDTLPLESNINTFTAKDQQNETARDGIISRVTSGSLGVGTGIIDKNESVERRGNEITAYSDRLIEIPVLDTENPNQPFNSEVGVIDNIANANLVLESSSDRSQEIDDTVLGTQTDEKSIEIKFERDLNTDENLRRLLRVLWSILVSNAGANKSEVFGHGLSEICGDEANSSSVIKNEDNEDGKFYYVSRQRSIATDDYNVGAIFEVNEGYEANDNKTKSEGNSKSSSVITNDSSSSKKSNIESLLGLLGDESIKEYASADSGKIGNETLIMRMIRVVEWNDRGDANVGDIDDDNGIESFIVESSEDCERGDYTDDIGDTGSQECRNCNRRGLSATSEVEPSQLALLSPSAKMSKVTVTPSRSSSAQYGSNEQQVNRGRQVDGKQHQNNKLAEPTFSRRHTKRALRSRPKIGFRKLARKITTTRVLVGAHLGSWAYRKFTNSSSPTEAATAPSAAGNGTSSVERLGIGGGDINAVTSLNSSVKITNGSTLDAGSRQSRTDLLSSKVNTTSAAKASNHSESNRT